MNRFAAGTFTPDPRSAAVPKMLAAQFALELKLLLRNGEQLLLTLFIPITLLVGLTLLPLGRWRVVAEQFQAGQAAPEILEQQCDEWTAHVRSRTPCPGAGP